MTSRVPPPTSAAMTRTNAAVVGGATLLLLTCASTGPKPAPQNPSPMVENTRAHDRVHQRPLAGKQLTIDDVLPKPVEVDITPACTANPPCDLVVHFLGASWLPMEAGEDSGWPLVIASVNLGAGSARYARPFAADPTLYTRLRERIAAQSPPLRATYLSGFSAGYGAIREILTQQPDAIDGVLLIDGLHTGYLPERKVIAEGGALDETKLAPFVRYAERAARGEKRFVVTHSEIFPGTFASTTETTDYLLKHLGMTRTPVVKFGPHGMQQLSESRRGSFAVLGFAGNSGPDHIDQLHGLPTFLPMLWQTSVASPVVARVWRGRVLTSRADEYARYLYDNGVVRIRGIGGNLGAQMFRRAEGDTTEFMVISYWPSRDAIKAFAGDDIEKVHFLPRDREFLINPDETVRHYEVSAEEWAAGKK